MRQFSQPSIQPHATRRPRGMVAAPVAGTNAAAVAQKGEGSCTPSVDVHATAPFFGAGWRNFSGLAASSASLRSRQVSKSPLGRKKVGSASDSTSRIAGCGGGDGGAGDGGEGDGGGDDDGEDEAERVDGAVDVLRRQALLVLSVLLAACSLAAMHALQRAAPSLIHWRLLNPWRLQRAPHSRHCRVVVLFVRVRGPCRPRSLGLFRLVVVVVGWLRQRLECDCGVAQLPRR